jgi:peptide/nickel transport system ATP-binding protein
VTAPVLEVRDLEVVYSQRLGLVAGIAGRSRPDVRAVDGVSLSLGPAEVLALAGESGCGKTTLVRTVMGLEKPRAGQVLFHGSPLGTGRSLKAYRRRVQMVFQDPTGSLNPRQTVYEAVAEGLRVHGLTDGEEDRVARALSRAGLRPADRFFLLYPHELSGGQRQRVVIAGALALEPEVLVADEPVSSLDASVRGEILRLLLSLRDDLGLAILVVTHDLGMAWTIADRVAVMYLGKVVEVGPTEEVLTRPLHPYTKALLEVVPEAGGDLVDRRILTGEPPDPSRIPPGCRFHPRCPARAAGETAAAGVEGAVTTVVPELTRPAGAPEGHLVACHLVNPPS